MLSFLHCLLCGHVQFWLRRGHYPEEQKAWYCSQHFLCRLDAYDLVAAKNIKMIFDMHS
jgi:hypothetical protein